MILVFEGKRYPVKNLAQASLRWQVMRDLSGLGASEMIDSDGPVFDEAGKQVARISYNGRVWPVAEWSRDLEPIMEAVPYPRVSH